SNASRVGIARACDASLRRLRVDALDLYLLHWPGDHPLEETIAGFEDVVRAGKVRAYGVSNFDVPELEAAVAIAGPGRIACDQVLYHLQERACEHRVIPRCEENRVAVQAYSPFGHGRFPAPSSRGWLALEQIAHAHGSTPRAVALAWIVRRPGLFALPKASSVVHVEENARALRVHLSDDDERRIDAAFPRGQVPRRLPTI
ncbi:MAG TPA: aldo/keto reductase, partial [Planctomycetota bacterium]|nr:aldo/keto reductase [Planctomycetota bacterium]